MLTVIVSLFGTYHVDWCQIRVMSVTKCFVVAVQYKDKVKLMLVGIYIYNFIYLLFILTLLMYISFHKFGISSTFRSVIWSPWSASHLPTILIFIFPNFLTRRALCGFQLIPVLLPRCDSVFVISVFKQAQLEQYEYSSQKLLSSAACFFVVFLSKVCTVCYLLCSLLYFVHRNTLPIKLVLRLLLTM